MGRIDQTLVAAFAQAMAGDFIALCRADDPLVLLSLLDQQHPAPDLPTSAFWLTISPGPDESRGEAGNASVVTPPLIALPDPVDEAVAFAWLDANFVGQELLDRFAQLLPEIDRFRGASGLSAEAS